MNPSTRANPSGLKTRPLLSFGTLSWDGISPLVRTIMAAPHPSGLYQVALTSINAALGTGGTFTMTIGWNQPRFGVTSQPFAGIGFTAQNFVNILRDVWSDGSGPITATITSVGMTGSPRVVIACNAIQVATDT